MKFPLALSMILVLSWTTMDVFSLTLHTHPLLPSRHYRRLPASQFEGKVDRVRVRPTPQVTGGKRSLLFSRADSCESTVPQPLLIGVVLGIFGTLFIQGFVLVLFRMYHKNQELRNKAKGLYHPHYHLHHQYPQGEIPLPSSPADFRHLEHIATSHSLSSNSSAMSSTAGLLRIAHRRPDGSWAFTEADSNSRSDARSEISSISPFATPLATPSSHRFPPLPSPRGVPSVPHSVSVGPRMSMDTITSVPGGYEKSVYSAQTHNTYTHINPNTHTPVASISRSAHSHTYTTPRNSSIHPTQTISTSTSVTGASLPSPSPSSSGKQQFHIQNLPPPSSPPPPMPLPPLPLSAGSMRSEQTTIDTRSQQSQVDVESDAQTQQTQSSSRRMLEDDIGSTRTGPPAYDAYIPTWREQQQMQSMPPLPSLPAGGPNGFPVDKQRRN